MRILKIPVGTEENPIQTSITGLSTDSFTVGVSPAKRKINGRLTILEVEPESPVATISELTNEPKSFPHARVKTTGEATEVREKLSDEKIIEEILKPAEKLRISKSSDKLLKVTSKNTAISLD